MKKYVFGIIAGVVVVGAVVAAVTWQRGRPAALVAGADNAYLTTRRSVQISEVGEVVYSVAGLAGDWLLFLHYPERTRVVELEWDDRGSVVQSDPAEYRDLVVTVAGDGGVIMKNASLRLEARLHGEGDYLEGTAFFKGSKNPVPASACRIEKGCKLSGGG